MKIIRVENKEYGIRYITEDCKYKIWKHNGDSSWRLYENIGSRLKLIKCCKYFKDAKQALKDILGE